MATGVASGVYAMGFARAYTSVSYVIGKLYARDLRAQLDVQLITNAPPPPPSAISVYSKKNGEKRLFFMLTWIKKKNVT